MNFNKQYQNTIEYQKYPEITVREIRSLSELKNYIEYVQGNIQLATKELTYWDMYKLSSAVERPSDFNKMVNELLPNTSLVINCNRFIWNSVEYNTGDIVIKLESGELLHILNNNAGVYIPKWDSTSKQLKYEFSNTPSNSAASIGLTDLGSTEGYIYGHSWQFRTYNGNSLDLIQNIPGVTIDNIDNSFNCSFPAIKQSGIIIKPVVKTFKMNKDGSDVIWYEEIYTSIQYNVNESKGIITVKIPYIVDLAVVK